MKAIRMRLSGPVAARPETVSAMLEQVMPEYQIASRHSVIVRAPAPTVYEALMAIQPHRARVTRVLFGLRRLPGQLLGRRSRHARRPAPATGLKETAQRGGFVVLTERPGRELLLGVGGSFWRLAGNIARLDSVDAWCDYQAPGTARAAMTVRVDPIDYQTARLYTETRVHARGLPAQILFRLYWTLISPFSGLIRRAMLRQAKTAAEQRTGLFRLSE
jgi:hypothetical protein